MPRDVIEVLNDDVGSIFVQLDGPNSEESWLGCHDMGDVANAQGAVTSGVQPDPAGVGRWLPSWINQASPEMPTFGISFPIGKTADVLEIAGRRRCPVPVIVRLSQCGMRDLFLPLTRAVVFERCRITAKPFSGLANSHFDKSSAAPGRRAFEFTAEQLWEIFALGSADRVTAEAQEANEIVVRSDYQCLSECGPVIDPGSVMFITYDSAAGPAVGHVDVSVNQGVTWANTAANPGGAGEHLTGACYFPVTATVWRLIVARGLTDAANPAEVWWSEDRGATWNSVNVGAIVGEFMVGNHSLWAVDLYHIWAVTDTGGGAAGSVYKSTDGGLTWTLQLTAADALNAVQFRNSLLGLAVGDTNHIYFTQDSGLHWTTITGPAAMAAAHCVSCCVIDRYRWWIGYSTGHLYYTLDGGTTWAERILIDRPTGWVSWGAFRDIKFISEMIGFLAVHWVGAGAAIFGAVLRTIDGGNRWEVWQTDSAMAAGTGLRSVAPIDENRAIAAGSVDAGGAAAIFEVFEE